MTKYSNPVDLKELILFHIQILKALNSIKMAMFVLLNLRKIFQPTMTQTTSSIKKQTRISPWTVMLSLQPLDARSPKMKIGLMRFNLTGDYSRSKETPINQIS